MTAVACLTAHTTSSCKGQSIVSLAFCRRSSSSRTVTRRAGNYAQESPRRHRYDDGLLSNPAPRRDILPRKTSFWHATGRRLHSEYNPGVALGGSGQSTSTSPSPPRQSESLPPQVVQSSRLHAEKLCSEGQLDMAMDVLLSMDEQGTVPSAEFYGSLLKACTKKKALAQARQVSAHLARHGLESGTTLGESVVATLVKCGGLADALQVFNRLSHTTAVSWTSIICGLASAGQGHKPLKWYRDMKLQGLAPTKYTIICLLKSCATLRDLDQGRRIHHEAAEYGWHATDLFVGTCLVDMYAKCGSMVDAQAVFTALPKRDAVSWTALLVGYVEQGLPEQAVQVYRQMRDDKACHPSSRIFVTVVQACGMLADKEEEEEEGQEVVGVDRQYSTKPKSLEQGRAVHADVCRDGYEADIFVGSTLVSMYGKCGSIVDAEKVFKGLPHRRVVAWNAMLGAYNRQAEPHKTLHLYEQMQEQGTISPDNRTFVSVLQACGMLAEKQGTTTTAVVDDVHSSKSEQLMCLQKKGAAIHAEACSKGFSADIFIVNTVISMYAKCGSLVEAEKVFNGLRHRNVVTWTIMLSTYLQHGEAGKALDLYDQMMMAQEGAASPDDRTFVSALQACCMLADKEEGGDALVDGQQYHHQKQQQVLKLSALKKGAAIHDDARRKGYESDVFVSSALVSMYSKCGSIVDAEQVFFANLGERDVVSWTAMIAAYAQQGQGEQALQLYVRMLDHGVNPNNRTFGAAIHACGVLADLEDGALLDGELVKVKALGLGKEIHAHALLLQGGCHMDDVFVGNTLVSLYSKCASIVDAQEMFDRLPPDRDVVSWNALLAGYSQQGQVDMALHMYEQMAENGVTPNDRTFVSALQACAVLVDKEADAGVRVVVEEEVAVVGCGQSFSSSRGNCLQKVKAIHALSLVTGYEADGFVGNTLVSVYGKCGCVWEGQRVFETLLDRQAVVVSWNAMLAVYVQGNHAEKSVELYVQMVEERVAVDDRTFVIALQACGMLADKEEEVVVEGRPTKVKALQLGKAIHSNARVQGYDSDVFVGNTLVSVYGKCGSTVDAHNVFRCLSVCNVVSWTALISAYSHQQQQGDPERALQLLEQMWADSVTPDEVTLVCVLQAASTTGNLEICRKVHNTFLSSSHHPHRLLSPLVANTLIHAYGKCAGSMADARALFDSLPYPCVVSWNALLAGYASQGDCAATLQCYARMIDAATKPDQLTFLSLLSACAHTGHLDTGVHYFESMSRDHGIAPEIEHYACLVDLLARAGCFHQIEVLVTTMPVQPDLAMWLSVLAACRKHGGQVALARKAFHSALLLQPNHAAPYVLMANVFTDAKLWDEAQQVADMRVAAGACKRLGQTWIEHAQEVRTFVIGDRKHADHQTLYKMLRGLRSEMT